MMIIEVLWVFFFPEALQQNMPLLFRGLYNKGGIQWYKKVKQIPHNGFYVVVVITPYF